MHLLSFDKVIDYEKEDYTERCIQYDIILDNKSTHSPFKAIKALKPGGTYLSIGGDSWRITQYAPLKKWIFRRYNNRVAALGLRPNKGLGELTGLVESGKLIPAVDKRYSLEEVPQAIRRFEEA
jgi:NADPH:quinone reductase-like Zn-dependent oxidoreductase